MTTQDDLIAFISARLDEEERDARGLSGTTWTAKRLGDHDYEIWVVPDRLIHATAPTAGIADVQREDVAEWIADHHPRRALRDVEAKREVLRMATFGGSLPRIAPTPTLAVEVLDRVIALMATAWSDHPDYRAGWAPGAR